MRKYYTSSRSQIVFKIGALHKFYRKTPVLESLFNEIAGLQDRYFPVKFVKFLRKPFFTEDLP